MTTLTVGTNQQYGTLTAAVAAARSGDTIDLQPGTYTNDFPAQINGLTIEGLGGIAKLVATAQPGNGKAILDVAGNTTLKNLDISGVTVPDANGAGIRYESGNLLIQNTAIHNNQNGILGASDLNGSITIDKSEIYGNGTSTGSTHNLYIGDIAQFTLTNSYVHDANTGHEIKSRAENTTISNNRIEDNASTASYEIDLPNGGNATISGNTIQKSASSGNRVTIAYGEEGSAHAGTTVSISNNSFIIDLANSYIVWDSTGAPMTASGNTTYNYSSIDKAGILSGTGFTATGTRPTLDTSSPIDQFGGSSRPTPAPTPAPTPTSAPVPPPAPTTAPASASPSGNAAPSLTATESVSGTTTKTADTLSGTVTDNGSGIGAVEIFRSSAGRTVDLGSAALNGSSWSYTVSNLTPGTYSFFAVAFDRAGHSTAPLSTGPSVTVVAPPTISSVSSTRHRLLLQGTAEANSTVTLTNTTAAGQVSTAGSATTASDGSWSISTQTVSTSSVNTLSVSSTLGGSAAGGFILASTAADTLRGAAGQPDVFAFVHVSGRDVVQGFETTAAVGSAHDVIDLSGTGYTTFSQLQPLISGSSAAVIRFDSNNSITLAGISASTLQASDFRFS